MIPRSVASVAAVLPTITQLMVIASTRTPLHLQHKSSINDSVLYDAPVDRSLEVGVDLTQCYKDINSVAAAGNILTKEEYFEFADIMSNKWFSDNDIFSYSVLPYDLKFAFVTLSCECHTMGGGDDCCENGHARLNVEGADGQDVSQAQAKYLNDICKLTFSTIGAERINQRPEEKPTPAQPAQSSVSTSQPLPTPPLPSRPEEDEPAIVSLIPTQLAVSTSQTSPTVPSTATASEEDEPVIVPLIPTQSSVSTSQTSPTVPSTATEEDEIVPLIPTQSSVSTSQPSPTPPPTTEEEEEEKEVDEPAIFPLIPTPLPNTPRRNDRISPAGMTCMALGVAALLSLMTFLLCGRSKEEKQAVEEENVDDIEANDKMKVDVDANPEKDAPDSDGSPDGTKSMTNSIFSAQSTLATTAAVSSANTKRSEMEDSGELDMLSSFSRYVN